MSSCTATFLVFLHCLHAILFVRGFLTPDTLALMW